DVLDHSGAREVAVVADIGDPGRLSAFQHPPWKADSRAKAHLVGDGAEAGEVLGIREMPNRAWDEHCGIVLMPQVDVPDRPARMRANLVDTHLKSRGDRRRFVGSDRNLLEKARESCRLP